jgi:ABC-2 type transport system permease protein
MAVFFGFNGPAWMWFGYGVLLGAFLFAAVSLVAHSLSFFWGDASAVGTMAMEFTINFSVYPDKIYASAVRGLMYSLIPAGLAVHVPLRLFMDFSAGVWITAAAGALLYCLLAGWFFYVGLKRYESGNVIVMRM